MSIDPAAMTTAATYAPFIYDAGSPGHLSVASEQGPSPASPFEDLGALERGFGALIAGLTKRFAALEKSFMQAMHAMMKGYQAAPTPAAIPARAGKFAGSIADAAKRYELDPSLLRAVVGQESGFAPRAVSSAGAMGLMQLMPDTARDLGVRDPFDPVQNLEGGARYLRGLIDRYHGHLGLALAAYNAGPGAVEKYGGVPPYPETQAYVKNILASYRSAALAS